VQHQQQQQASKRGKASKVIVQQSVDVSPYLNTSIMLLLWLLPPCSKAAAATATAVCRHLVTKANSLAIRSIINLNCAWPSTCANPRVHFGIIIFHFDNVLPFYINSAAASSREM